MFDTIGMKEGDLFFNESKNMVGEIILITEIFVTYKWLNIDSKYKLRKVKKNQFEKYATVWHNVSSLEKELI
jgi:hypothetical protein